MPSRLEDIQSIIQTAPDDPFPRYGLAMEYKNLGRMQEALAAFDDLQRSHPDYVAQYLIHGNLLVEMKRTEEAHRVFTAGIAVAKKARNNHALSELTAALEGLSEEED